MKSQKFRNRGTYARGVIAALACSSVCCNYCLADYSVWSLSGPAAGVGSSAYCRVEGFPRAPAASPSYAALAGTELEHHGSSVPEPAALAAVLVAAIAAARRRRCTI